MKQLSQNEKLAIAAALIVVAIIFLGSTFDVFSRDAAEPGIVQVVDSAGQPAAAAAALRGSVTPRGTVTNLIVEDIVTGAEISHAVGVGDKVTVHYVGSLQNGVTFADSKAAGEPITFTVGAGEVIEGWERGVVGMRVGGQRVLVVPPSLAYGNRVVGSIPPNSTLVFAIELIEVRQ